METKKAIKIIFILVLAAILIFLAVILINNHIEKKGRLNLGQELDFRNPLAINDFDLISGSGPLDIIVYEDYNDAFSADFAKTLNQLQSDFNERIRIIYRFSNASNSALANQVALAVSCAQDQGQGLMMRQALFSNREQNILNGEGINLAAEQAGLKEDKFTTCINSLEQKMKIEQLNSLSQVVPVYGAPTTFIDREIILGARPYEAFVDSNGDEIEGLRQVVERHLN